MSAEPSLLPVRPSRALIGPAMSALLLLLAHVAGCATRSLSQADASRAAWAESVADLRRSADAHLNDHDLAAAEADLRRILVLPAPKDDPRAKQLLQDARFALGSIELVRGRHEEAIAEADAGLSLTEEESIFSANLHALRAMCLEASGRELDAIPDYEKAIAIHKRLFDEALGGAGEG